MLSNSTYRTEAGSTVEVSGAHGGRFTVAFDWLEEPDACCDCRVDPDPVPTDVGGVEYRLTWHCAECGGGSAKLRKVDV